MNIQKSNVKDIVTLTMVQKGILFDSLNEASKNLYNVQITLEIQGKFDVNILRASIQEVQQHNDVLRSVFDWEKTGKPLQIVLKKINLEFNHLDYSGNEAALETYLIKDRERKMDLKSEVPIRFSLIKTNENVHFLVITHHAILYDGWSTGILLKELFTAYKKNQSNREKPVLKGNKITYKEALRSLGQIKKTAVASTYWPKYLQNHETRTLPRTGDDRADKPFEQVLLQVPLKGFEAFTKKEKVTKATLIYVAYGILLQKYLNTDDVVYATPVSNRNTFVKGSDEVMGNFINTLPLRVKNNPSTKVRDILMATHKALQIRNEYADSSYFEIKKTLGLRPAEELFDSVLAVENYPLDFNAIDGNEEFEITLKSFFEYIEAPLLVQVFFKEQLEISLQYSTHAFGKTFITALAGHFKNILTTIIANPEQGVDEVQYLDEVEKSVILESFNDTKKSYSENKTVLDLFGKKAKENPNTIALVFDKQSLTYGELDEKSDKLALHLISEGVTPESLVPICLDRSFEMIIGILGILKAGGAYVPIDPQFPQKRIGHILEDTKAKLLLTTSGLAEQLDTYSNVKRVLLDTSEPYKAVVQTALPIIGETELIYVIYTSGTTGIPKGVMNEHKGVFNRLIWMHDYLKVSPKDVVLQKTTFCFDVSAWEIFLPLTTGARMVLAAPDGHKDSGYLQKLMKENTVTIAHFVPSMLSAFLADLDPANCPGLVHVVCSGEELKSKIVRDFKSVLKSTQIHNLYGPTEASIEVTAINVTGCNADEIPIGWPIANTKMYVVDKQNNPQPIGVPGELLIGGVQVARGYLNNKELTQQRFVASPFKDGERLYRTGDVAKWLPDGALVYLGRKDNQVKIRGYRIELGEIENALEKITDILQAVVVVQEDEQASKQLVAYVVLKNSTATTNHMTNIEGAEKESIKKTLLSALPAYMVPQLYIALMEMPLSLSGKVDRKSLPEPNISALVEKTYVAPITEIERDLVDVWENVLGISPIGISSNFFELGGDSIKAIQLMSRAKKAGIYFKINDVFKYQTIQELSENLKSGVNVISEEGLLAGRSGLLPIQQEFFETKHPRPNHYNQSAFLSIPKGLTDKQLSQAVSRLIHHHDALRFQYHISEDSIEQSYGDVYPEVAIVHTDENRTVDAIRTQYQESLDIEKGEVCRFVLIRTKESTDYLFIVIHHLCIDGVSWRILVEDLELLIKGAQQDQAVTLTTKQTSYRQWQLRLKEYANVIAESGELNYWKEILSHYKPFPKDRSSAGLLTYFETGTYEHVLDSSATHALLHEVHQAYTTEINDILLSALGRTLGKWSGFSEMVIAVEGHGREELFKDVDVSRTLGWFTSIYPVPLKRYEHIDQQLQETKDTLRDLPNKGIGYGVMRYMAKKKEVRACLDKDYSTILFNYLGSFDNSLTHEGLFSYAADTREGDISPYNTNKSDIAVNSMIVDGELRTSWSFNKNCYDPETIQVLAKDYENALESIIDHCRGRVRQKTRTDYGLPSVISNTDLSSFMKRNAYGEKLASIYELSPLQKGMLFHSLYEEEAMSYVGCLSCDFTNGINVDFFTKTWAYLVDHHSVLRTAIFPNQLDVPVQGVYRTAQIPFKEIDFRNLKETELENAIQALKASKSVNSFDLGVAPLFNCSLILLPNGSTKLLLKYHHIVCDGWSLSIIMGQFIRCYDAILKGKDFPNLEHSDYNTFIAYLKSRNKQDSEAYWRKYLRPLIQPTYLPFIKDKQHRNKIFGNVSNCLKLEENLVAGLLTYARTHRLTLNTLVQGAWAYLLSRYTSNPVVAFGATVSGRDNEFENAAAAVGLFINTLPVCTQVNPKSSIVDWLMAIQKGHSESRDTYGYASLNEVQRYTGMHDSLFDSLLVFENYPIDQKLLEASSLSIKNIQGDEYTNYVLTLLVSHANNDLSINFDYNKELIAAETVERMQKHLKNVLRSMISGVVGVEELEYMSTEEEDLVLRGFNENTRNFPKNKTILDFFIKTAAQNPGAIALEFGDSFLTYGALDEKSARLARHLVEKGVVKGSLVPICLERSFEMVVGILGILRAGGAYVPIDPTYPMSRIGYILKDIEAQLLLTSTTHVADLTDSVSSDIELIELDNQDVMESSSERNLPNVHSDDLIYVIYTSGTTGIPKGVMNEHGAVLNRLLWMGDYLRASAEDCMIQKTTFCFDVSVGELFLPFLTGARLVIAAPEGHKDARYLQRLIAEKGITMIHFVPSMLSAFLSEIEEERCGSLSHVFCSGEELKASVVRDFNNTFKGTKLHNFYGPTEAAIEVTAIELSNFNGKLVPIGKPMANTSIYIVDDSRRPCPIGVAGELLIGGVQVARGYLNLSKQTAEKFINSPFKAGERLYCTGDLAKWLPDGTIVYLGRNDRQVKVRGYRIELSEIEAGLHALPFIAQAVVSAPEMGSGRQLIGYVVLMEGHTFDRELIIQSLRENLPEHMIPQLYMELAELPLTLNGKVNRKKLPDPRLLGVQKTHEPPTTVMEKKLVEIWEAVLGVQNIGVSDNFFELGGDSIKAIQLMGRSRTQEIYFSVKDLFKYQNIANLSANLKTSHDTIQEEGTLSGPLELLPIQQKFFAMDHEQYAHYNQSVLLNLPSAVPIADLSKAISALVAHHDALRMRYELSPDGVKQFYGASTPTVYEEQISTENSIEEICLHYQKSLQLEKGELCRFVHIKTDTNFDYFFMVVHHLAVDGVSWRILIEDLQRLLGNLKEGKLVPLPRKGTSYRQWGSLLEKFSKKIGRSSQVGYWRSVVSHDDYFPTDNVVEEATTFGDLASYEQTLSNAITRELLQEVHDAYDTEINDILLTALCRALTDWTGNDEVTITLEGHGRENLFEEVDISRTVGWFTSIFPVRLKRFSSISEQLVETKDMLRDIPNKGIGYGLLRYLCEDVDMRRHFKNANRTVLFNYLGGFDNSLQKNGPFTITKGVHGKDVGDLNKSGFGIAINGMVVDGECHFRWSYDAKRYSVDTIKRMANTYLETIVNIIEHCKGVSGQRTRSDFGLPSSITNSSLNTFLSETTMENGTVTDVYRLSPLQEGILFHSLLEEEALSYVSQFSCDFPNGINMSAFEKSWEYLMEKHAVLRTSIHNGPFEVPIQCVHDKVAVPLKKFDYSDLGKKPLAAALNKGIQEEFREAFNLKKAALFEFVMVQLPENRVRLFMRNHHILWDGWSLAILMGQFMNCYENLLQRQALPHIEPSNYRKRIDALDTLEKSDSETFWKTYLKKIEAPVYLPFIQDAQKRNKAFGTSSLLLDFEEDLTKNLESFAQENHLTMNTILQGVWAYLLSRYTGDTAVVFGATVSGRDWSKGNLEEEIGLYINTLPVVTEVSPSQEIGVWLSELQEGHAKGRAGYSHTSLGDIQIWMGLQDALFDSLLVFENYPVGRALSQPSTVLSIENVEVRESTNYVLTLGIFHSPGTLSIKFDFNDVLLTPETVRMIQGHFTEVVRSIVSGVQSIKELNYIDKEEESLLIADYSCGVLDGAFVSDGLTVLDLLWDVCSSSGSSICLSGGGTDLSYDALWERSDALSVHLRKVVGASKGDRIGVYMPRVPDLLVAVLGIWKAGCAYVPVDVSHPLERLSGILADSGSVAVLVDSGSDALSGIGVPVVEVPKVPLSDVGSLAPVALTGGDLSYVLYTSGTSGRPKGVLVSHGNLYAYLEGIMQLFPSAGVQAVLSSNGFDIFHFEVFRALLVGGRALLLDDGEVRDMDVLLGALKGSNSFHAVPALMSAITEAVLSVDGAGYEGITELYTGGDTVPRATLLGMREAFPGAAIHEFYGPTEGTVFVTVRSYSPEEELTGPVTIGRPMGHNRVYVLDRDGLPCPVGVVGELYIGGPQVTLGYLGLSGATSRHYVASRFDGGGRLYRSGDLAKWLPDGSLVFLGRNDRQLKVRGHRIEPGEVERALEGHSQVSRAVVSAPDLGGGPQLIAHVVGKGDQGLDQGGLARHLGGILPDYMVPRRYVVLERLPLTANGKVDHGALPLPAGSAAEDHRPPETETEKKLVQLWSRILNIEEECISVTSSFFNLGGDSIKAMRLFTEIKSDFGVDFSLKNLFEHATVKQIAQYIELLETSIEEGQYEEYSI